MARVCQITGKKPQVGNNVSHSNRKTRRRFLPNLQVKRIWDEIEKRMIKVRVCRKGLKLIDKIGVKAALLKAKKLQEG